MNFNKTMLNIALKALEKIKKEQGKVCKDFELCNHIGCKSSAASLIIACEALEDIKKEAK